MCINNIHTHLVHMYVLYAQAHFLIDDVVTRNSHRYWRHAFALELQFETENKKK